MPSSHPESAAFLLVIILLALLRLPLVPTQGMAEEGGYLAASCGTQPVPLWGAILLSSSSLLGLPGMLQRSFTGQQSLCRLRGNRSHSLSAWIGSGREQLRMWVLHAAESIENLSKEGKQLQSVILATEGCKSNLTNKESLRQTTWCLFAATSLG